VYVVSTFSSEPTITADKIEFRKKENITIFSGNVKTIYDKHVLTADYVRKDDLKNVIYAEGNVKTYHNPSTEEKVHSSSDFAKYYAPDRETLLWGKPYLIYKSTSSEMKIYAEKILLDEKNQKINFDDNVLITQETHTAESPHATYFHETRKLYLYCRNDSTEMPSVEYSNEQHVKFIAREVTMLFNDKKFIFEKEVFGKLYKQGAVEQ
jgi:lipopolysaccharide export system protein LptA